MRALSLSCIPFSSWALRCFLWLCLCCTVRSESNPVGSGRGLLQRQKFLAGQFHHLGAPTLAGLDNAIYRSGRLRFRPLGSTCGEPGSSVMDAAVQPPCVGNICNGPASRVGDLAVWEDVRVVRVGVYQLCWCRPSLTCQQLNTCCREDADFGEAAGEVEVVGPGWILVSPVLGQGFRFELVYPEALPGSQVLLRLRQEGPCGLPRDAAEERASLLRGDGNVEDEELPLATPADQAASLNFTGDFSDRYVAYLYRHLTYTVCWCAQYCFNHEDGSINEEAFGAEVGLFYPRGPDTENMAPQYAVAGVSFALYVQGDRLSVKDRVLVPESSTLCGDPDTGHALAFRSYICGRGQSSCIATPANGPPTSFEDMADMVGEAGLSFQRGGWEPVQIDSPGTYRICWCVDDTWDPVKLESHGYCGSGFQYGVEAGLVIVQGAVGDQDFPCSAFQPCQFEVHSELPFDAEDQILIVAPPPTATNSLATICGRGTSGLQVRITGWHAVYPSTTTVPSDDEENTTTPAPLPPMYYVGNFQLDSAGQAGLYRVCYCKHSEMGPCDDAVAFAQYAGTLNISGEIRRDDSTQLHQRCLSNSPCKFNVTGVWAMQLSFYDSFKAVPLDRECGEVVDSSSHPEFSLLRRMELLDSWASEFSHRAGAETLFGAGDYRLCYCQASMTSDGRCDASVEHTHEIGSLYMVGALSTMEWSCRQGADCGILVHGWRVARGDAIRLVPLSFSCGDPDPFDAYLGAGFDYNPAVANRTDNLTRGVLLHFDLGKARGSGTWRVCLCVAAVAKSASGCTYAGDYAQPVGELMIEGLLRSVSAASSQPATVAIASILVEVIEPGGPQSVACAASNQTLDQAPSSFAILNCKNSIPGCLGLAILPWQADEGFNVLHLPFAENALLEPGVAARTAHVWCTGDIALCPTGRCVLPPTPQGRLIPLDPGPDRWTSVPATIYEPLDLKVHGNPLNANGGYLKIVWPHDGCPEVGQPWADAIVSPFDMGRPVIAAVGRYVQWRRESLPLAGTFWLCWCDRSYGADCALWQHVGELVVAGPTNVTRIPEFVELLEAFNVTLSGVNLSDQERLSVQPGQSCSEDVELFSPERVYANTSKADFEVQAPRYPGPFSICWTRGNISTGSMKLANGFARESRDCLLGGWEPAPADELFRFPTGDFGQFACSRACGGGLFELRRRILAEAIGGGSECPPSDSPLRSRLASCNEEPCPTGEVFSTRTHPEWVKPGDVFQILVEGAYLDPLEDRVVLLTGGEDAECGQVHSNEGPADGGAANASENGTDTVAIEQIRVLRGGGASCRQPSSNSTHLECGDGLASLTIPIAGTYRICICDASEVDPGFSNISGSLVATRERCSQLEDFWLTPGNGSLLEITESQTVAEEPKSGLDAALADLIDDHRSGRADLVFILGLIAASILYCLAIFCACWFWRYRWRKRAAWRRLAPNLFANSLVAKATRAAWEAYTRTITEQAQISSGLEEEPDQKDGQGLGTTPRQIDDVMQGTLTPPGTGYSLKSASSIYSGSTSSTRSTTPGNHPSLLKVSLNRDPGCPFSPKQAGGSFLDLPLAGRGSRPGTSPTRPNSGATTLRVVEESTSPGPTAVEQASPRSPSGERTPQDAEETSPPSAPSRTLELQLPGLEKKLAKLKRLKEEYSESSSSSDASPVREAPKGLVPVPPSMAPPTLPGQLASAPKPAEEPAAVPEAPSESPRPSEVPAAPVKQVPSLSMLKQLPPPPPLKSTKKLQESSPAADVSPASEASARAPAPTPPSKVPRSPPGPTSPFASSQPIWLAADVGIHCLALELLMRLSTHEPGLTRLKDRETVPPSAPPMQRTPEVPPTEENSPADAGGPAEAEAPFWRPSFLLKPKPKAKASAKAPAPTSPSKVPRSPPGQLQSVAEPQEEPVVVPEAPKIQTPPSAPSPTAVKQVPRLPLRPRSPSGAKTPDAVEETSPPSAPSRQRTPEPSTSEEAKPKETEAVKRLERVRPSVVPSNRPGQLAAPAKEPAEAQEESEAVPEVAPSTSANQLEVEGFVVSAKSSAMPGHGRNLPTGSWQDTQDKLQQEWYSKLAAGVDDNEKPGRRGKASLRGAASGSRRVGASLRGAASASASAAGSQMGSQAPSRSSQSPAMSPRSSGTTEGSSLSPQALAPAGSGFPPPGPALGPGPGPRPPRGKPGPGPGPPLGASRGPQGPRPQSQVAPNWAF
eukprot:s635_g4.t2